MQLTLTKEQFLELMRLAFIGEMAINGHKTEGFDTSAQDFQEWLVGQAVEQGVMDYVECFRDETYDYSNERSTEFFRLLDRYCDQQTFDDLVETVSRNILHDTLGEDTIESMSPEEFDDVFLRTAMIVERDFQKNDYDNLILRTAK